MGLYYEIYLIMMWISITSRPNNIIDLILLRATVVTELHNLADCYTCPPKGSSVLGG